MDTQRAHESASSRLRVYVGALRRVHHRARDVVGRKVVFDKGEGKAEKPKREGKEEREKRTRRKEKKRKKGESLL